MKSEIKLDGNKLIITIVNDNDILKIELEHRKINTMMFYTKLNSGEYADVFDIYNWKSPVMRWSMSQLVSTIPILSQIKWGDDVLTYTIRLGEKQYIVRGNLIYTGAKDSFDAMVKLFAETMCTEYNSIIYTLFNICDLFISKNTYIEELEMVLNIFEPYKITTNLFKLKFAE